MWPVDHRRGLVSKVPEVTIAFWITKILTTGMGETASDYLVHRIGNAPAVLLGALAFTVALALQFRAPRYVAGIYWLAVVMVSVFGTMVADVLHIGLGIPYAVSTVFFMVALAVVFFTWQKVEGTLSIHSIFTPRRELFYWAAVLTTFSLGTAAGDLTAIVLHLGYFSSGLLFALIITLAGARLLALAPQLDRGVLAGVHRHSAPRCVVRRLDGRVAPARRPRLGQRRGEHRLGARDPRLRGVPRSQPNRP